MYLHQRQRNHNLNCTMPGLFYTFAPSQPLKYARPRWIAGAWPAKEPFLSYLKFRVTTICKLLGAGVSEPILPSVQRKRKDEKTVGATKNSTSFLYPLYRTVKRAIQTAWCNYNCARINFHPQLSLICLTNFRRWIIHAYLRLFRSFSNNYDLSLSCFWAKK